MNVFLDTLEWIYGEIKPASLFRIKGKIELAPSEFKTLFLKANSDFKEIKSPIEFFERMKKFKEYFDSRFKVSINFLNKNFNGVYFETSMSKISKCTNEDFNDVILPENFTLNFIIDCIDYEFVERDVNLIKNKLEEELKLFFPNTFIKSINEYPAIILYPGTKIKLKYQEYFTKNDEYLIIFLGGDKRIKKSIININMLETNY